MSGSTTVLDRCAFLVYDEWRPQKIWNNNSPCCFIFPMRGIVLIFQALLQGDNSIVESVKLRIRFDETRIDSKAMFNNSDNICTLVLSSATRTPDACMARRIPMRIPRKLYDATLSLPWPSLKEGLTLAWACTNDTVRSLSPSCSTSTPFSV